MRGSRKGFSRARSSVRRQGKAMRSASKLFQLSAENADRKHGVRERDQIDLTGIASRSSTSPTSFCRNGSAYVMPPSIP